MVPQLERQWGQGSETEADAEKVAIAEKCSIRRASPSVSRRSRRRAREAKTKGSTHLIEHREVLTSGVECGTCDHVEV